jgi:hypothetical protein
MRDPLDGGFVSFSQLPVNLSGNRVASLIGQVPFDLRTYSKIFDFIRRHTSSPQLEAETSLTA